MYFKTKLYDSIHKLLDVIRELFLCQSSRPTQGLHTVLHIDPRILLDPPGQGHHEDLVLQDHPYLAHLVLPEK